MVCARYHRKRKRMEIFFGFENFYTACTGKKMDLNLFVICLDSSKTKKKRKKMKKFLTWKIFRCTGYRLKRKKKSKKIENIFVLIAGTRHIPRYMAACAGDMPGFSRFNVPGAGRHVPRISSKFNVPRYIPGAGF